MYEPCEPISKKIKPNATNSTTTMNSDRLSSLPDSILISLFSHLPISTVVSTSILSRRYRSLWTQLTHLSLNRTWLTSQEPLSNSKFCTIVTSILLKVTSPKLNSFTLCFPSDPPPHVESLYHSIIQLWLSLVLRRHPEHIQLLTADCENTNPIPIPDSFFQCPSLVSIKIDDGFFCKLPHDFGTSCLPNLKKLHLNLYIRHPTLSSLLFKSCTMLEDLVLSMDYNKDSHVFEITCPNLKRLCVYIGGRYEYTEFMINTPKLEYFEIDDIGLADYRFVVSPSGLLDADILVYGDDRDDGFKRSLNLVQGICNARSLQLELNTLSELYSLDTSVVPMFRNLTDLSVGNGCNDLVTALMCSPNLEDLFTMGSSWNAVLSTPDVVPSCLSSKIRKITVWDLGATEHELGMLRYILGNAKALDVLILRIYSQASREAQICKILEFCAKGVFVASELPSLCY